MDRPALALCLLFALCFPVLAAEPVGVLQGVGVFQLDGNPVAGNATLLDGSRVESSDSGAELRLNSGSRLWLYTNSAGRAYARRLILERGAGQWESPEGFVLEAGGLRILAEGGRAAGRIALVGGGRIQAVADSGVLRVTNFAGITVARMRTGMALEFEPQQKPVVEPPFEITGCLERRPGGYVLADPVTGVVEEVRGERLDQEVGNVVEITARLLPGVKPIEGAMEVIQVLRLRRVSRGCPVAAAPAAPPAKPGAASAPAPTPTPMPAPPAGMSGAKKAVIAGVVVGGAGAGAAVFLLQKKEKQQGTISP